MKVLVIGANGQVGKHLVAKIQDTSDIKAKAMIRKEEQVPYFEDLGAETVLTDLEKADIDEIAKAAEGTDAIVFTAGSGPKTGDDKTMLIDLDAAVKTIEAAKKAGVKRYIMVSSFDTTREEIQSVPSSFAPYVVAKHYADVWLRATDLDYTIVHPGGLTNDAATGKVQAAENVGRGEIPREDVASVLLATLQNDSTIGKEFQVVGGETTVDDAVKAL
ncbi:SDR family oxidoreductase [Jeotgalibacillus sp. R-1-5s-1]|uniref:SDR family oxidoreductase n=1 Tax=Jeotgalibacillus sp. R-1-5s-1 TaxID=2555897 RepID=UPI001069049F|nr:SDR family oxidoreductase [Jeotgalibacillus sp. R-1-5s-1]TFD94454.1 SDR family oxidoreductase [Jeotgalibacillus sp. R-1-5s-1]